MSAIKKYLPKSLFGRALAIIIVPIALMQIAVTYFFFEAHWQTVTSRLSESVAADIAVTTELYMQAPGVERAQRLDAMIRPDMQISVRYAPGDALPDSTRNAFFSNLDRTLRRALSSVLDAPFWFDTTRYPNHIDIRVAVDGGVLYYIAPRERVFASTGFIFILLMLMATAFLTLVSILFILNQARPIVRLAEAADAFGKGRDIGKFKPSGATEVRQASQAFLNMRDRIGRHIEQRTVLLAGVSHDLRTPLTRLKLHLAMSEDDEDNRAAKQDLADMEQMLDGYLDFARGLAGEEMERCDVSALVESITESYDADKISTDLESGASAALRPIAIKRAVTNLIENGLSYAKTVRVTVETKNYRRGGKVLITIDDDGPGIDEAKREEAFKPFMRLDTSRNQNTKGVGLGLSIAQDTARAHGGDLSLEDSPMGGLRAVLSIPV